MPCILQIAHLFHIDSKFSINPRNVYKFHLETPTDQNYRIPHTDVLQCTSDIVYTSILCDFTHLVR